MGVWFVMAAAVAGVLVAPLVRHAIVRHSVVVGQPWRRGCPHCSISLRFVPPLGGCVACHRPPGGVVELLTAAVFALLAWRLTAPVELLAFAWIGAIGVALAFVDVAVHRLPDRLTLSAYFGGAMLLALTFDFGRLGVALLCSLAMTAGYLTLILISPSGMGLGDGKLALSLGLALGWFGGWVTFYGAIAGFLLSGLFATAMLLAGRLGRKDSIAHGPFMLMGTLVALALLR